MVPTLWWVDYHHGTYMVVTWLPSWYLHYGGMTTIMGPATLWGYDYQHGTITTISKLKDGVWSVSQSLSLRFVSCSRINREKLNSSILFSTAQCFGRFIEMGMCSSCLIKIQVCFMPYISFKNVSLFCWIRCWSAAVRWWFDNCWARSIS